MRKSYFLPLLIATHIFLILLHIQKQHNYVDVIFKKQSQERAYQELLQRKDELTQNLYAMTQLPVIKNYAQAQLNMIDIRLSQTKKIAGVSST